MTTSFQRQTEMQGHYKDFLASTGMLLFLSRCCWTRCCCSGGTRWGSGCGALRTSRSRRMGDDGTPKNV